mmetsp:Transcript_29127/g.49380  ORF Transcript_29127/g.49380 Transcript_29127/m.49380 type:complete len:557 (+) Transcript_29127:21-1691(+)
MAMRACSRTTLRAFSGLAWARSVEAKTSSLAPPLSVFSTSLSTFGSCFRGFATGSHVQSARPTSIETEEVVAAFIERKVNEDLSASGRIVAMGEVAAEDGEQDEKNSGGGTSAAIDHEGDAEETVEEETDAADLKPREVMAQLDRYIVGQRDAKKTVAVAYRNRWRRHRLPEDLKEEVMPKNILMVGPTGVGKTEIARRLSKLSQSPFIKVEATKFTEIGFHGRDVDQIIRDLVEVAINMTKTKLRKRLKKQIEKTVEDKILKSLVGQSKGDIQKWREHLRKKELEDMQIDFEVQIKEPEQNMETIAQHLAKFGKYSQAQRRSEKKKMRISEARPLIEEMEMENHIKTEDVTQEAIRSVEQDGIVFIDEIDKICTSPENRHSGDASSEGVQRDLLPIIEGCTINTKHGNVATEHILFVASGAFSACKPSDLLAELQGRLPLKVELKGLSQEDLYRILTEPENNLIRQQVELMKTEGVTLVFEEEAIRAIARVSSDLNSSVEDIGARRLHTVIERIVDDISFEAPERSGETVTFTADDVNKRAEMMMGSANLKKFII